MEKILSMSKNGKSEYCCSVVRIGELVPVEGSDFLAKTDIFGTQIVIRKDSVKEGDLVFYASNETAINQRFLSVNNLFEIGFRNMNSNYKEVESIVSQYDSKYRNRADELKKKANRIKSDIKSLTNIASKYNQKKDKLQSELDKINAGEKKSDQYDIDSIKQEIEENTKKAEEYTSKALSLTSDYAKLKNDIEGIIEDGKPLINEAKKLCGYFNNYGRVRCIMLLNEPSFGFIFGKPEMEKYCPEISDINLEDYVGCDFDTVNGELFVKAYVPPIKSVDNKKSKSNNDSRKSHQVKVFNRYICGEFAKHYDTDPLEKNMYKINENTDVCCSLKIHGKSSIIAKIHVKEKIKINIFKELWNKFAQSLSLPNKLKFIDYNIVYGPIYSSRNQLQNNLLYETPMNNQNKGNIWCEYGDIIYPYMDDGTIIYGEVFGYETGKQIMLQKYYDYGCNEGENQIMIYRIVKIEEDGSKREYEVEDVYKWTVGLIEKMKANGDESYKRIHPIDILYSGKLSDLYKDIEPGELWRRKVLKRLSSDKDNFLMNELEPLCKNKVPREGIVVRIIGDKVPEAFKCKCTAFRFKESVMIDSGEVDGEMYEAYGGNSDA